jgi:GDPmannose 4,6-dehydratase
MKIGDYLCGMWLMLQQEEPDDFVLATGETTTVRAFCEMAIAHLGIKLKWVNEKGILHDFNAKQFEEVTKLSAFKGRSPY